MASLQQNRQTLGATKRSVSTYFYFENTGAVFAAARSSGVEKVRQTTPFLNQETVRVVDSKASPNLFRVQSVERRGLKQKHDSLGENSPKTEMRRCQEVAYRWN